MKNGTEGRHPAEIAKELFDLTGDSSGREAQVRGLIAELLRALGAEAVVEHWTGDGPADLYLPRRRVLVETKRRGGPSMGDPHRDQGRGGDESAFGQLERYVQAEIRNELRIPGLKVDDEEWGRDWTGVLTDGCSWWSWRWPHAEGGHAKEVWKGESAANPEGLVRLAGQLAKERAIGKPRIPASPMELFEGSERGLREVLNDRGDWNRHALETKHQLWLSMLQASGMAPQTKGEQWDLFLLHCLLVTIARGVIRTLSEPSRAPDPESVLAEGFVAWIPETEAGQAWAEGVLGTIHRHEWRLGQTDVLRTLYQAIIPSKDRKMFGEYYTPDWLAALLAEGTLDSEWREAAAAEALKAVRKGVPLHGTGLLDPTCGSGTFLYHAALLLQETDAMRQESSPQRQADAVCRLVNGLDIHPVAVELARATLMRALPATPTDGEDSIRIHQGDTLLMGKGDLFGPKSDEHQIETPHGGRLNIPVKVLESPSLASDMRVLVSAAQEPEDSPKGRLPVHLAEEPDAERLERLLQDLRETIRQEGNAVWAWYIVNSAAPLMLSRMKVDRILANPPWVRMSDIQELPRKQALEDFAGKPRGRGESLPPDMERLSPPPPGTGEETRRASISPSCSSCGAGRNTSPTRRGARRHGS